MEQSTGSSYDPQRKSSINEVGTDSTDSASDCRSRRQSCSSIDSSTDEANARCSSSSSVPGWTIPQPKRSISDYNVNEDKDLSEVETMKERFAKLLLGEDMSGSGNGVCSAIAISNAITNLCVAVFGQLWRLEPLSGEKKAMWRREMDWLLNVTDHIIELIPSWQTISDGSKLEIMSCKPRVDLFINIPALRKLDNLLIDMLDTFEDAEFWYVDLQKSMEEKWWLPVPRLPPSGLHENTRKKLQNKRECSNQIMKAAMVINSMVLAEMDVPESYLQTLPKTGRVCLGDLIYRYINSSHFSSEFLPDFLDLSSEHQALEIANRIEAAIYVWRRRSNSNSNSRIIARSGGRDRREVLARRAESVLFLLKQRFPNLTQTSLETCKILHNKDIGKSILESYSRVIESLAVNVVARMDDLLYVDDLTKKSDKKKIPMTCSVPVSSTPRRSGLPNPSWSPASMTSPAIGERTPFLHSRKPHRRGNGVKKVLANYLGAPSKVTETNAGIQLLPQTCTEPAGGGREKAKAPLGCLSMSIS